MSSRIFRLCVLRRRFEKKVTVAETTMLHHRYVYRGYLQIAALDLTRAAHPALWLVTWDPGDAQGNAVRFACKASFRQGGQSFLSYGTLTFTYGTLTSNMFIYEKTKTSHYL